MVRVIRDLRDPILEGVIWLAIASAAYALTYEFDEPLDQYLYGATGWPRVLIAAMAIFAAVQATANIIKCHRRRGTDRVEAPSSHGSSGGAETGTLIIIKRLGTFAAPLVYLFLMPRIGYYIITPIFLAGYMMLLGERRLIHLIGTTLMIFALTMVVFTKLLFVPLPIGNWPGFYEINNLFLSLIK